MERYAQYKQLALILLSSLLLFGCEKTTTEKQLGEASWSDDGNLILYYEHVYDSVTSVIPGAQRSKNHRFQFATIEPNGTGQQYVGKEIFARSQEAYSVRYPELFYKTEAGYILLRVGNSSAFTLSSKNGTHIHTSHVEYVLTDLQANELRTFSKSAANNCRRSNSPREKSMRIIPSPNGATLALIEDTAQCTLSLKLLDYHNDLEEIFNGVVRGEMVSAGFWYDNDLLLLDTGNAGHPAWKLLDGNGLVMELSRDQFESLCLFGVSINNRINQYDEYILWDDIAELPLAGEIPHPLALEPGSLREPSNSRDFVKTELNATLGQHRLPDNPPNCISPYSLLGGT